MKICPVCQAKAFDDAEVCYGCLHRFCEEDVSATEQLAVEYEAQGQQRSDNHCVQAAPEFCIKFSPAEQASGEIVWNCKIETKQCV